MKPFAGQRGPRQSIQIRAVAYVNLADLYYQLNRGEEARVNYEKYLQLAPNSPYSTTARAGLGKP